MPTLLKAKKYVPHYERGGKFSDKTEYLPVVISDSEINKLKVKDSLGLSLVNHIINVMPAYNTNVNSADMFLSMGKHGYVIEQVSRTQFRLFNVPRWDEKGLVDYRTQNTLYTQYGRPLLDDTLMADLKAFMAGLQNKPKR